MRSLTLFALAAAFPLFLYAQHDHHNMKGMDHNMPKDSVTDDSKSDSSEYLDLAHPPMGHEHDTMEMEMTSMFSRNLPMQRDGSGTSWLPDNSPLYADMFHSHGWMLMLHYNEFIRYTYQNLNNDGKRGGGQFNMTGWIMGMAQTTVGTKGIFAAELMVSPDPFTVGAGGYPLLFQTGETYQGKPLVDRQHPHNLISALAVSYTYSATKNFDISAYLGYPGEPALGPPVFMHRPSAMSNPDAPLGHHWQDATHISYGVGTLGFRFKMFKLEGSVFNGLEPDENRYNFDKPRFNSYSVRLSVNPVKSLAVQYSVGRIDESTETVKEVFRRSVISAIHSKDFGRNRLLNTTLVIGVNTPEGRVSESFLIESEYNVRRSAIFARYEYVKKDRLLFPIIDPVSNTGFLTVQEISGGYEYGFNLSPFINLSIGAMLTANPVDKVIKNSTAYVTDNYGTSMPVSAQVFIRLSPPRFTMHMLEHLNPPGMNMDMDKM